MWLFEGHRVEFIVVAKGDNRFDQFPIVPKILVAEFGKPTLQRFQERAHPQSAIQVLLSPTQIQRQVVMAAEQSQAFKTLVESVKASYVPSHRLMTERIADSRPFGRNVYSSKLATGPGGSPTR